LKDLAFADRERSGRQTLSGVFYSEFLLNIWKDEYSWADRVLVTDTATLVGFEKKTALGNIFYSLPFGWYGGISGDNPADEDLAAIFDWIDRRAFLQENIVQLTWDGDSGINFPDRYQSRELTTHVLDLHSEPGFNENTRRNIKWSVQSEISLTQCHKNNLPRFTTLLREQVARTRERRRLPEHFYSELYLRGCSDCGDVVIRGAESDGELCAVHIYFRNESDIFYFDGVASERGVELGANFLIFDDVITRGRSEGLARLNFGATPPGDVGLERFKSGWGAKRISYKEYYRRSLLKQGIDFVVRR
jgi:hypothetical protein